MRQVHAAHGGIPTRSPRFTWRGWSALTSWRGHRRAGLGEAAERAAAERLKAAIEAAAETNVPEGELLWRALDAMRLDVAAFRRWR
ncbi:hypothetical protein, partial [Streptomyces kaniharaensis]|uniref:hypothetical protein n=1 Tax=Streptomyces kaniharaensis TaxID=212423 RepID=UPI001E49E97F